MSYEVEPTLEFIKELVPLRFPVLLVDRVLEWVPGESIVAIKGYTSNEVFFGTSCPDAKEPPRALMIEALVQCAGLTLPKRDGKYIYLLQINSINIHRTAQFGEVVTTRAKKTWERANMFQAHAVSTVNGCEIMDGDVTYAYLDAPQ